MSATGTPPLFQTQNLVKVYRAASGAAVRALDDVSLAVPRGSLTLVRGPSGSGKTTLLALLGALERPTAGAVIFDGRDLTGCSGAELTRVRRRLGFVFQEGGLLPDLSVLENVTYPLLPRGVPRAERKRRAGELLDRLGIGGRVAARARELSGGERQRVALARALAGHPEAVLADEPTAGLDESAADAVRGLFRELHAAGATIVLAAHDPAARALATEVCELAGGRIVASDGRL